MLVVDLIAFAVSRFIFISSWSSFLLVTRWPMLWTCVNKFWICHLLTLCGWWDIKIQELYFIIGYFSLMYTSPQSTLHWCILLQADPKYCATLHCCILLGRMSGWYVAILYSRWSSSACRANPWGGQTLKTLHGFQTRVPCVAEVWCRVNASSVWCMLSSSAHVCLSIETTDISSLIHVLLIHCNLINTRQL